MVAPEGRSTHQIELTHKYTHVDTVSGAKPLESHQLRGKKNLMIMQTPVLQLVCVGTRVSEGLQELTKS